MRIGFRGKRFSPWLPLALIMGLAAFIRWRINFGGALMPGVNGPYYPVQVRSLLENGRLGFPDFPFIFWLEALVARLLFALKAGTLSDCIMWASKGVDAIFPALAAIPAFLLARAWLSEKTSRPRSALIVAVFSVLYPSALVMTSDFQKNAAGAVWLFFYIYYLYRALQQGSWKNYLIAGVFFVLTGLTHIGCFGVAIVCLLVVVVVSLLLEPARRGTVLRGAALLFLFLVAATAGLYLFFDPARIERLLGAFLLSAELFEQPAIFALLRGQGFFTGLPDFINLLLVHILAMVGIVLLVKRWATVEPARRLIVLAAAPTILLLASPFFNQDWAMRLSLIAYVPATVVLAFLLAALQSRTAIRAITVITLVMISFSAVGVAGYPREANISEASYEELHQLREVIAQPKETLVLARHGLEWWAAWVLETDVGQRPDMEPEVWDDYAAVLYLVQIAGAAEFGPGGPVGPPFPEVRIPPDAEILFEGQHFRLARATQPQPISELGQKFEFGYCTGGAWNVDQKYLAKDRANWNPVGVMWERSLPGFANWQGIEPEKGQYRWGQIDKYVREAQEKGIQILFVIWPFTDWDQEACNMHLEWQANDIGKPGYEEDFFVFAHRKGRPCDMEAYKEFLRRLVERYDGDGIDDIFGLRYPVRYWEIGGEADDPNGDFFQGSTEDYFEILKVSYTTIKETDPNAKVLMAAMMLPPPAESARPNFDIEKLFELGAADYFDIRNSHGYGGNKLAKEFLAKYGADDKPAWVTEPTGGGFLRDIRERAETEGEAVLTYLQIFTDQSEHGGVTMFFLGGSDEDLLIFHRVVNIIRQELKDSSLCEEMADSGKMGECYIFFAAETKDVSTCEKITDRKLKEQCYGELQ